jgi:hypothetical protein
MRADTLLSRLLYVYLNGLLPINFKGGRFIMIFWVIAFQYQEDVFWDFALNDESMELKETCFLPTEETAKSFIAEHLGSDYVPVKIDLERVERNGTWTYSRGPVQRWDEEF